MTGGWNKETDEEDEIDDEDSVETKGEEGEKKSLKEKMQAIQEIALLIQVFEYCFWRENSIIQSIQLT